MVLRQYLAPNQAGAAQLENLQRAKGYNVTSKMRAFPGHEPPDRIHLPAEGHRLFAEQLLPKVISALGGSHPG